MATTTNYGWTTPDDTGLVKDGASAIRTLGTSVDTTTKNLNPSTTLGDIEYRSSSANVNTRLGIGSTGNVLTVAGGVPTWAAPAGGAGNMAQIATGTLSGTSVSITGLSSYTDLFLVVYGTTNATNDGTLVARLNSDTGSNYYQLSNTMTLTSGSTAEYAQADYSGFSRSVKGAHYNTDGNNSFAIKLTNCKNPGFTDMDSYGYFNFGGSQRYIQIAKGVYKSSAAVSSLQIENTQGYTWNAGTYTLWGA